MFNQREIVAGTCKAARAHAADDISEANTREALKELAALWDELFPAEQERIVAVPVERADAGRTARTFKCAFTAWRSGPRDAGGRKWGVPIAKAMMLHVPLHVVKRAEREEMQLPDAAARGRQHAGQGARPRVPLEADAGVGRVPYDSEQAERECIASSYMTRVLRLSALATDIVETILDGKQGPEVTLARAPEPFQLEWRLHREHTTLF